MKRFLALLLPLLTSLISIANAESWPDGYVVYGGSISPDKHFGILIPSQGKVGPDENRGEMNYLTNLETHQLLGKIDGARYWERGNHVGLKVRWTSDSSVCVPIYEARFGFHSASALLLNAERTAFRQINLGEKIRNDLDRVIREKSTDASLECEALLAAGVSENEIFFRALGETNPKQFEDLKSFHASFSGIYNLKSDRWSDVEIKSLNRSQFLALDSAIMSLDEASGTPSPESEAHDLDDSLNRVYQRVRSSLTAGQFAQVKQEQIAWLKRRDSVHDLLEKNKLIQTRIEFLIHLLK